MRKWLIALFVGLVFTHPAVATRYDLTFAGSSAAGAFSGSLAVDPATGKVSDLLLALPSYTIDSTRQSVDMSLWSYDDYDGDYWQFYIYAYNPLESELGLQFDGQLFLAFPDDTLEYPDLSGSITTERLIYGTLQLDHDAGLGTAYTGSVATISLASAGSVPEPASWLLALSGFGLIGAIGRRRGMQAEIGA